MLQLQQYLQGLENKTGWVAFVIALLGFLQSTTQFIDTATLGAIATGSGILLILLKLFAPTGKLETNWKWTFYVANGLIAVLGIANILGEGGYMKPDDLVKFTVFVNAVIGAFQMWLSNQNGLASK